MFAQAAAIKTGKEKMKVMLLWVLCLTAQNGEKLAMPAAYEIKNRCEKHAQKIVELRESHGFGLTRWKCIELSRE